MAISALQKQISKLNLIGKINYHSNFYYTVEAAYYDHFGTRAF